MRFLHLKIHRVVYVGELSFEEVLRRALVHGLKAEALSEGRTAIFGQYGQLDKALWDVTKKVFQRPDEDPSVSYSGPNILGRLCAEDGDFLDSWPPDPIDMSEGEEYVLTDDSVQADS